MNLKDRFQRFMYGRYGNDSFNRFLLIAALVLYTISIFTRFGLGTWISLALLIYAYVRMLSRNTYKRAGENTKYLTLRNKVVSWWKNQIWRTKDSMTHHIYRCPGCRQKIRVPRGKGRISIRCPKCGTEFIKKS